MVKRKFEILIVDDNVDLASSLEDVLKLEGYNTAVAADGQTALALCRKRVFALALIDIKLPDMPGAGLIEKLAELSPRTEYIIITGYASLESAIEAVTQKSIVAYETKPLDMDRLLVLIRQVVKRRQAEEKIRKEQEFTLSLLQGLKEGFAVVDQEGKQIMVNDELCRMTGYSRRELLGQKPPFKYWAEEGLKDINESFEKTLRGVEGEYEIVLKKKNGERFIALVSPRRTRDADGNTIFFATVKDVTERKQAEDLFQGMANSSPIGIYIVVDGKFQFVNPQFQRYTGYSEDELLGMEPLRLVIPEDRSKVRKNAVKMLKRESSSPYEYRLTNKDGKTMWILETVASVQHQGRRATLGNFVDITERKRVEAEREKLRAQLLQMQLFREKAYLGLVLDSVADGVYVTDSLLNVTHWNPAAERITGWTAAEVIGKPCADFLCHQNGQGELVCHTLECPLEMALSSGGPVGTIRVSGHTADGRVLPLSVSTAPVKDEVGTVMGIVEVFRDVSMEVELERLKDQLLSTVSHELRTPLASIKGYSTMLLDYDRRLRRDEKYQYLRSIDRASDRLTELIDHLLDMSRLEAGLLRLDMVPIRLDGLLYDTVAEAQLRSPQHRLRTEVKGKLPRVKVDVRRIRQVLDNLLDNAIKYSEKGTEVVVWAQAKSRKLEVSVTDQGRGIPAAEIDRVFDRMYRIERRLAQDPGGMGLGLALCKALVETHGGRIWVESVGRRGTTVYFTLPMVTEKELPHGEEKS